MSLEKSGHLPRCKKDPTCERPASETVYDLEAAAHIQCCRQHRREVNRLNARFVGKCQYLLGPPKCQNFPVTMRYLDGEDIAVCALHDSHINQQYASMRKNAS